jgi:two-component system, NarL family, sensor histidine kinase DesK
MRGAVRPGGGFHGGLAARRPWQHGDGPKEEVAKLAGTDGFASCDVAPGRPGLARLGATGKPDGGPRWGGPGTNSPMRWFFSAIWLVYLIAPIANLFGRHHTALWIAGGLAIAVVFCGVYIALLGMWDRWSATNSRLMLAALGTLFVVAVLACLVYGADWTTSLWVYVSAATGFTLPVRRGITARAVVGVAACYSLLAWISHVSMTTYLVTLLPVLLIGWAMIGFRIQIQLMRQLRQARETVAQLAANEERLRLARDMHDLTGQSLSLITLKSDLAVKRLAQLAPSAERDAVLGEISDIGRVSRQTLHDIREAVSGYRRPTLAVEIITARTSLESAGIGLDDDPALTVRSGTFDPDAEAALAWCLREAATNVIRHSGAKNCRIRLTERAGEFSLEVSDDGRGLAGDGAAGRDEAGAPGSPAGSGLHGMSERLSSVGGRLSVEPASRDGRGFRLVATVPASPGPAGSPAVPDRPGQAAAGAVDANVPS